MKKIVAFLNSYIQKSGGDVCFVELFKRIDKADITIITSQGGKEFCLDAGLKAKFVITTKDKQILSIIYIYLRRTFLALFRSFNIPKVDIVYATSDALPDVLPAVILKLRFHNSQFVGKVFHIVPSNRFFSFLNQKISHILLKIFANQVIVDNTYLRNKLISSGFRSKKITVNYPGIDTKKGVTSSPKKAYTATFLSRIHESKGIYDLIPIWKKVVEQLPSATLGIIGTGNYQTIIQFKNMIKKNHLEQNILVLGFMDDKKTFSLIKGSKVFLFASHEEGFGITVGEVLTLDVPIVSYDLDIFQETFKDALLTVPCFNKTQFAEQIISVIMNPQKYSSNRKKVKKIMKRFTWDNYAKIETKLLHL